MGLVAASCACLQRYAGAASEKLCAHRDVSDMVFLFHLGSWRVWRWCREREEFFRLKKIQAKKKKIKEEKQLQADARDAAAGISRKAKATSEVDEGLIGGTADDDVLF